ncbi:ABC transporter substrate-binding protein [Wukongibacter sp. M2B1]|uniref:ABC transporter substrate-binding protein n=1 Tax=Wukongibacter sp. M2B1 TaxID=3088895 RepID=UPI003D7BA031
MKKIIKQIALLALLAVLFVGCAGMSVKNNANTQETRGNNMDTAWSRTIIDAAGNRVVLDKQPQRIAILHSLYLEYFFALETPPIASAGASRGTAMKALEEWETLKPYEGTANIIDLGSARDLNLEAILEVKPDVIVTFKGHVDKIYDQLVQIAPVILMDFNASWQDQTLACAEIVGKEAYAKDFIKETESIISSSKEKLSKYDKTITLFRTKGKSFVSRGNKDYYDTFGISKPKGYPDNYEILSLEAVAEMNPDYIVFQEYIETAKAFVKSQEAFSIWNNLDAVKNGHVFYFNDSLNTLGPLTMRITAEELLRVFSEQ